MAQKVLLLKAGRPESGADEPTSGAERQHSG